MKLEKIIEKVKPAAKSIAPFAFFAAASAADHLLTYYGISSKIGYEINPIGKAMMSDSIGVGLALHYALEVPTVCFLGAYKTKSDFINKFLGNKILYIVGASHLIAAALNYNIISNSF